MPAEGRNTVGAEERADFRHMCGLRDVAAPGLGWARFDVRGLRLDHLENDPKAAHSGTSRSSSDAASATTRAALSCP